MEREISKLNLGKTEWNLSLLLKDESSELINEDLKEIEKAASDFIKKWKSRSDYLENADSLKEALDDYERWTRFFGTTGKTGFYFWLKRYKYQNDPQTMAGYNKLDEVGKKIGNDIQFFLLNLGKISKGNQDKFLKDSTLTSYSHFLKRIFDSAKYNLSDEQEKIMNLMSSNAYQKWVDMITASISSEVRNIEINGRVEEKSFDELLKLSYDKDKKLREMAFGLVNDILKSKVNYAEVELNALLSYRKIVDDIRGFDRPDKERHVADDIEDEVVDTLIDVVTERFSIAHRYYELKAKLLGLGKLEYNERNIEYGAVDKEYKYHEALNLVYSVFGNLDKKFAEILKDFSENGRIDVYPSQGKKDGAFCAHQLISSPTYVLLNHTGRFDDVTTLAHEMGHAINNELSKVKQNALNFGTCLATAEVASTFMEDFVVEEVLKGADEELKLAICMKRLDDSIRTIVRQTACYNFEKELHSEFRKKNYLSKEEIGKIFQKNMGSYMGPYVEQSSGSENWWVYWWHIREYFYVYSYVSGLLISKAMQRELKKDPKFILKVKEFLSSGVSDSPKHTFIKMGIDITKKEFWNEGLDEVEKLLNDTENLAKNMGKLR